MSTFSTLILCGTLVTGGAANVTTQWRDRKISGPKKFKNPGISTSLVYIDVNFSDGIVNELYYYAM